MIIATKAAAASGEPEIAVLLIDLNGNVFYMKENATPTSAAVDVSAGDHYSAWFSATNALSGATNGIWRSVNQFVNWTQELNVTRTQNSIIEGSNELLSVGGYNNTTGQISYYSTDNGDTWTAKTPTQGFAQRFRDVTRNGTQYLAVGDGSTSEACQKITSPVASNSWSVVNTGAVTLKGCTYGNGLYVVVGENGVLRTSSDLTTWTARTSQFSTTTIESVATDGTNFVAVGQSGKISDSTNGTTWNSRTSGIATSLRRVVYSSLLNLWIASGDSGKVLTSSDRVNWTDRSPTAADFYALAARV